eukprot:TRINITY_DN33607_c0_g1_i1.p1 TRINITY_DN33607_c0_g1~~TRINITY_DN33607_c0_g1_i1.p1  ORF type:complete len:525 (-),score=77.81 TRINITY_DN33607_c0_g1_i1:81-1607(-)
MGNAVLSQQSTPARSRRERSDVADLEKHLIVEQKVQQNSTGLTRSQSFSQLEQQQRLDASAELRASQLMREPGGFRRDFLQTRALNQGVTAEQQPDTWNVRLLDTMQSLVSAESHRYGLSFGDDEEPANRGASNLAIAFLIFKGNCGCAILYMPRAWRNGGYLTCSIAITVIGACSIFCCLRLLDVRRVQTGSYGDIMHCAAGPRGRALADFSIVMLQSGICCSYFIVVAELLQSTLCPHASTGLLIVAMALSMIPLAAIRKVSALWPFSCLGTVLVIVGVFVVLGFEVGQAATVPSGDISPVTTWSGLFVCIGQACFMFEGVGLVLPTFDSCRNPRDFPRIYAIVLLFILGIVFAVGILGYLAYGESVQSLVLLNFPESRLVTVVRVAFMVQVLCSFPLQMLPAIRLVENLIFAQVSNPSWPRKAAKSTFRGFWVILLSGIAFLGSNQLDNFVSLIGSFCGVPLAFTFPAYCHYRIVGSSSVSDVALITFGILLTVIVSAVNIAAFM